MIANDQPPPAGLLQLAGFPLACVLAPSLTPEHVFRRLSRLPYCLFLDSSLRHDTLGRYSFIAADPFETLKVPVGEEHALETLRSRLSVFATPARKDLPPFQGGAAGVFSYELGHSFESLPSPTHDELQVPAITVGLYDVVVAFDHRTHNAWIISHGWPETDPSRRQARAHQRMKLFLDLVHSKQQRPEPEFSPDDVAQIDADHFSVESHEGLFTNFQPKQYQLAVAKAIEYIRAGDIFQANVSQRLLKRATASSPDIFLQLRRTTPAPFAAYFDAGDFQVISASPERFLSVRNGRVEARPMKGTRPLTDRPEVNQARAAELKASEKDQAENVMIVDLLRNDLSKVCQPDSLAVPQLCGLESYGYVQHLVSVVHGHLREDQSMIDLIAAAFPGGSITGAPKRRAMEIITELEQVARGAYCGALGYLGWDGTMDLSILIRTITARRGWWHFPVGGGVTANSIPQDELAETWDKAAGLLRAL
jgi:para-aminobenzoate synthetase component 1